MPRKPRTKKAPPADPKPVTALAIEATHERAGLRLVSRAIRNRWNIPAELMDKLPSVVVGMVAKAKTDRERLRAVEVLVAMERDNMAALAAADRVERLDGGKPTELVELLPITLRVGGGSGG
jgi:hypothetical protein